MSTGFPRRNLLQLAGAAALLRRSLAGQQAQPQAAPPRGGAVRRPLGGFDKQMPGLEGRATVSIIQGENRTKNVYNALMAIDKEVTAKLKGKKSVVIKPNFVNTQNQLAASHVDGVRGIIEYLNGRFKGPIYIAESSAGNTNEGYANFKYTLLPAEYKRQQVSLIDLNEEGKFERVALLDKDLHIVPCRLAARLLDPDAFVISSAMLKTHNTVIASLSIKNMVLGAPLHQSAKEAAAGTRWNEKRKYHVGLRQTHYNMMRTAQKLARSWHLSVIDGYEGMEGNGPNSGTPVPSRIALASTDFVAVDRVSAETMGIDPAILGYVKYSGEMGLGQFDPAKIDVIGAKVADVKKPYRMHPDFERELKWQGPMDELPFNLGWTRAIGDYHEA
jgi:uncharacterized protein (DUF362 family)